MKYIHPRRLIRSITKPLHDWFLYYLIPDEWEIQRSYKKAFGHRCNLKTPTTFNEKIQWLKLHDRNPMYPVLTDKLLVKEIVAKEIGEQYVIPTLFGGFSHFKEIPFESLPNQFVIKCNHDSQSTIICKDKRSFDYQWAKVRIENALKRNYYYSRGKQWGYKDIKPQVFVEEYVRGERGGELDDYKFYMFNGECKTIFYFTNRFGLGGTRMNCYDANWNLLPFTRGHQNTEQPVPKPENLQEMLDLAQRLAALIKNAFVRIDLYSVHGRIFFGEYTFYPGLGYNAFNPVEWDSILGNWIDLNTVKKNG